MTAAAHNALPPMRAPRAACSLRTLIAGRSFMAATNAATCGYPAIVPAAARARGVKVRFGILGIFVYGAHAGGANSGDARAGADVVGGAAAHSAAHSPTRSKDSHVSNTANSPHVGCRVLAAAQQSARGAPRSSSGASEAAHLVAKEERRARLLQQVLPPAHELGDELTENLLQALLLARSPGTVLHQAHVMTQATPVGARWRQPQPPQLLLLLQQ